MSTPAEHGGAAPPPARGPETPAEAIPPPEAEGTAEVLDAPETAAETPQRGSAASTGELQVHVGQVVQAPTLRDRLQGHRTTGWWLAQAEGTATPQAGAAGALRYFYAEELGLPPLAAQELWLDGRGKLAVSAMLMRALAEHHGYSVVPHDWSDEACTAVLLLEGVEIGRYTYTMAQAHRAGLDRPGSGYIKDPDMMMWARAASRCLRLYLPGLMLGLANTDQIEAARGELRDSAYDWSGQPEEPPTADGDYAERERDEEIPF